MAATIKDDAPYKDFAERLRKLRENAGLTRAQLGEKSAYPVGLSSITKMESVFPLGIPVPKWRRLSGSPRMNCWA